MRGVLREARKARLVLVPRDRLASKVSAPPKTFLIRAEALYMKCKDEQVNGVKT